MSTPFSQSTSKRTCKTKEDFSEHNFQKIEGRYVQEIYASCDKISGDGKELNAWY
jgi:hypothetical protein